MGQWEEASGKETYKAAQRVQRSGTYLISAISFGAVKILVP